MMPYDDYDAPYPSRMPGQRMPPMAYDEREMMRAEREMMRSDREMMRANREMMRDPRERRMRYGDRGRRDMQQPGYRSPRVANQRRRAQDMWRAKEMAARGDAPQMQRR